jgi:hypothetical protein
LEDNSINNKSSNNNNNNTAIEGHVLDDLETHLEQVAMDERSQLKHVLSKVGSYSQRHLFSNWSTRCQDELQNHLYWPEQERMMIATLTICVLDPQGHYHCTNPQCYNGNNSSDDKQEVLDTCDFCLVPCPNQPPHPYYIDNDDDQEEGDGPGGGGCTEQMSRKYLASHLESCPYQIISCSCGVFYPRRVQRHHQRSICPLREVTCPFASIGCTSTTTTTVDGDDKDTEPKRLQAYQMGIHLQETSAHHLDLTLERLLEVQTIVRTQHERIGMLEEMQRDLQHQLVTQHESMQAELLAAHKRFQNLEKKLQQQAR